MKIRVPVFVLLSTLCAGTAWADIIGVGTRNASIFFDPGFGTPSYTAFDIPLGDVTCVFLGTCAGPLQLPPTEASQGDATSSGQAGIIAGFSANSWGFLPTVGTMVGQDDPTDAIVDPALLRIDYMIEFFTDAGGFATSDVSELLYLTGTVGGPGSWVRVTEELTLESESDGILSELFVDFFTDTPGDFQGVLSGATTGAGAIQPFDTFWVRGFYLFEAHNQTGPTSISTTTPPQPPPPITPVPEPGTLALVATSLVALGGRRVREPNRRARVSADSSSFH